MKKSSNRLVLDLNDLMVKYYGFIVKVNISTIFLFNTKSQIQWITPLIKIINHDYKFKICSFSEAL
jgi:hypothetical protein